MPLLAAALTLPSALHFNCPPTITTISGVIRSSLNACLAPKRQTAAMQLLEDLGHAQQPLCFHARLLANGYMEWGFE